ncbi:MAG: methyltransferase [Hyphomonadaceae bacterium]
MKPRTTALCALLAALRERSYEFVTPTPASHARVLAKRKAETEHDLRDIFGWSLPFAPEEIDGALLSTLRNGDLIEEHDERLKSRVRVSSLDGDLFAHSAYPTTQNDAVFFGPDSYRFATFLRQTLPALSPRSRLVDIGAGSGVGAIVAARITQARAVLTDINPLALNFAAANWAQASAGEAEFIACDGLSGVNGDVDLIIANPPYIADPAHRAYRDGGGMHGGELSFTWAHQAARRLERGGAFLLYTGSAIVDGEDKLKTALFEALDGFDITYREIDPDVFGEELEREDYADVERIAVVGLVAIKR